MFADATKVGFAIAVLAGLAGCGDLPKDPARTTELIRKNGEIRVGMVSGVDPEPAAERVLERVSGDLGARVSRTAGPGEKLMTDLERGRLDVVYGDFAATSPWKSAVYLGQPPGWRVAPPKDVSAPRFAYRLGENGWIMKMERAALR